MLDRRSLLGTLSGLPFLGLYRAAKSTEPEVHGGLAEALRDGVEGSCFKTYVLNEAIVVDDKTRLCFVHCTFKAAKNYDGPLLRVLAPRESKSTVFQAAWSNRSVFWSCRFVSSKGLHIAS